jgi:hypothetical protein
MPTVQTVSSVFLGLSSITGIVFAATKNTMQPSVNRINVTSLLFVGLLFSVLGITLRIN